MQTEHGILYLLLFVSFFLFSCKKDIGELPPARITPPPILPTLCVSNWGDQFTGTYRCLRYYWSVTMHFDSVNNTYYYTHENIYDTVDVSYFKTVFEPHCDSEIIYLYKIAGWNGQQTYDIKYEKQYLKINPDSSFQYPWGHNYGKFFSTNNLNIDSYYHWMEGSMTSGTYYWGKKIN